MIHSERTPVTLQRMAATKHRLADLDQRSAESCDEIDTVAEVLRQLAEELEDDAVPIVSETWDDTSMVHHVQEVQKRTKPGED